MIDETWYVWPEGVPDRTAAGGVVVRAEGENVFVALAREANFSYCVLPKGGVEPGETREQAARREIGEEAGLTDLVLVGALGSPARLDFDKVWWTTTHYFLFTTAQIVPHAPTDTQHHDRPAEWFPLGDLPPMFWPEQRALIMANVDRIVAAALRYTEKKENP